MDWYLTALALPLSVMGFLTLCQSATDVYDVTGKEFRNPVKTLDIRLEYSKETTIQRNKRNSRSLTRPR